MVTKAKTKPNNGNGYINGMCRSKRLFLEKYPEYGSIGATLKAIGIKQRRTFYFWCEADPHFEEIYRTELLPNRRDELVSRMYRIATGQVKATAGQLTALFGFLKATDHVADDDLVFTERYQHELMGKGGGPIALEQRVNLTALTDEELSILEHIVGKAANPPGDKGGESPPASS